MSTDVTVLSDAEVFRLKNPHMVYAVRQALIQIWLNWQLKQARAQWDRKQREMRRG